MTEIDPEVAHSENYYSSYLYEDDMMQSVPEARLGIRSMTCRRT